MASSSQAQRSVVAAGAVLLGMIWFNAYQCRKAGSTKSQLVCGGSTFARVWVAGILVLGLAFAADWVPQLVVPFAFAVVVGFTYANPGLLSSFIGGGVHQATTGTRNPTRIDQRQKRAQAGLPD